MKGSWKIVKISGIQVSVHWTFLLLVGFILLANFAMGNGLVMGLFELLFVLSVFLCVVLHEFGHALAARKYDIQTRDITILPIGGVARLERMPTNPSHEFWIAVAGPAVNIVIAACLLAWITAWKFLGIHLNTNIAGIPFLSQLMWINVALVLFNLLPAFPMDGGRVFRSILARRMEYEAATRIAARVGQFMAVGFGVVGFFYNPFLIFIALFIFFGAQAEADMAAMNSVFQEYRVRDAMITRFSALSYDDPVELAVRELLSGSQHDFPVVRDSQVVGVLTRADLVKALAEGKQFFKVGEVVDGRNFLMVADDAPLENTVQLMKEGRSTLPVVHEGQLVGLLTLENLGELMMVRSALQSP